MDGYPQSIPEVTSLRDSLFKEYLSYSDMPVPGEADPWNMQTMNAFAAANKHALDGVDSDIVDGFKRQEAPIWVGLVNARRVRGVDSLEDESGVWTHDTIRVTQLFAGHIACEENGMLRIVDK